MHRKTPTSLKKSYSTQTWVIQPDVHFAKSVDGMRLTDRHDARAVSVSMQIIEDIRPDNFIQLGDLVHLVYLSHWNVQKGTQGKAVAVDGEFVNMSLKEDHLLVNTYWDRVRKICRRDTKIHAMEGNHELWLRQSRHRRDFDGIDKTQFFPEKSWDLAARGISWTPYERYDDNQRNWVDIGKHLKVLHGQYANASHLFKHWQHWQGNLIYGHLHTRETKDFPHPKASTTVQTIGCLCTKRASYHQGRNNAWSQGMSVVHLLPDGTFRDEFVRILDGKAYYNGKVYTAKEERWME